MQLSSTLTTLTLLQINNTKTGEMLVAIKPDGSIEYGPNYNPDEAAKIFWEAMGKRSQFDWAALQQLRKASP